MVDQMLSNPEAVSLTFFSPDLNLTLCTPAINFTFSTPDLNLTFSTPDSAMEEDIVESNIVDEMFSNPEGVNLTFSTPALQQVTQELDSAMVGSLTFSIPDLHQVTDELDSAMQQVEKLIKGKTISSDSSSSGASFSHGLTSEVPAGSSWGGASFSSSKSVVVGIDADLMLLKDRLTGMRSKLEIVPIVGMGGIGKTTLAQKLYEDPLIVSHFNFRAWTTVSQSYNVQSILVSLIRCITGKESYQDMDICDLKVDLHRSLFGRRYMIVLDDIWSNEVWDEIRKYFPNNNNGSRILITTRESDVAKHADTQTLQHQVKLLSKSESWDLLRQIVFGEKDCPDDVLQGIGEKIASDCSGLPLAITVIGGLLSKVERSKDVWEKIGENVRVAISESDEQFSNILSLSYNHLPYYLKLCFLYMGAFPEDYEIKGSRLIPMWLAEGFLRSNIGSKSLEEEAEDCVKALVERNLLMVRKYKYGKPRRYIMHDLLRDLCIRKAGEEKFLHVKNSPQVTFSNPRRVSVHTSMEDADASAKSTSLTRSFISTSYHWFYEINLSSVWFALRLLRVLDVRDVRIKTFPTEIFQFVNLRFLAVFSYSSIPSGISRLWNLQALIADSYGFDEPSEIWQLSELRHLLNLNGQLKLLNTDVENIVLKKLETISEVLYDSVFRWHDFVKSIPNVKKLGIYYKGGNSSSYSSFAVDLSHLQKLETLSCHSDDSEILSRVEFPCNLRKLTLRNCAIPPGFTTTLCTLPNLEVLKIRECRFGRDETENEKWELAEGDEFRSLQYLYLIWLGIESWRADESNFPKLRHLVINQCYPLEEIPSGIGEIPTLQLIELQDCSESAEASARQIEKVQQSDYGNYDLQLRIHNIFSYCQKVLKIRHFVRVGCNAT